MTTVRRSVEALITEKSSEPKISIQFFGKKKQFKVFIEMTSSTMAKAFFQKCFTMKTLPILAEKTSEIKFEREMRAYLVKSENEFTRLAKKMNE